MIITTIAFAILLSLLISAAYIKTVEVEAVLLEDTVVIGGNSYYYDSIWLTSSDGVFEGVFSLTVHDGTIKCAILTEQTFNEWQEGKYEPHWFQKGDHGEIHTSFEVPKLGVKMYFLFFNENSYDKSVNYQLTKVRQELVNLKNILWIMAFAGAPISMGTVYFALKSIKIPTYLKFIIYPITAIIVVFLLNWSSTGKLF